MSARSLTRTFRRATGISVHEFSTRVRVELARALLNEPSLTMEAIAQRTGLSARQLRRFGVRRRRVAAF
ncbi:MAG: helix-turn-helix domain-containing protein [Thermoanaerobaculia bacterium]